MTNHPTITKRPTADISQRKVALIRLTQPTTLVP